MSLVRNSSILSHGLALATLSILAACSHDEPPPVTGRAAVTVVTSVPLTPASPGTPSSNIYLSEAFRGQCGIKEIASQSEAPKFDYDRSAILPADGDVLAQVAQCLLTGSLKDKNVKLVGRADPRGTVEYNMALGARRSTSVMTYLAALGVPASRMQETSRGALDATGSDGAAWQLDRRVDVDVLGATP